MKWRMIEKDGSGEDSLQKNTDTLYSFDCFLCYTKGDSQAYHGISWDVIWLIVATTPLAAAFQAEECGIMPTVMGFLTPILTSMSPAVFIIACTIILGITTQVVHNLILAIVFIPILCPLCASMGGNPYACFLVINMALMMAFVTPAASMNAGMIFGHFH